MAKYKAYPEYKDSGVEWLGEVPNHWKTVSISRLFSRIKRTGYTEKELLSVYRDYGVIPKSSRDDNNNKPSEDLSPYQLVEPNDLVMNKMKAWQGSIAISEYEGIVSPAYFVYKPNNILFELAHPRYVHYLLRNPIYVTQYLSRSKGIRVNQWDLDPDEFRNIELLLPDKTEQEKIYSFLDHETAKIDNLIEKQQQLIELLKEKRQAVISHAVTKGLNPDVPMKDSGVEWLGEVPEHWEVSKFGYISLVVRGGSPRPAGDPTLFNGDYSPWVTVAEITKDNEIYLDSTDTFLTKKGSEQCRVFKAGTLLLSNSGATLGVPKILRIDANANDGVVGFELLKIDHEYAYFYLLTLTTNLRESIKQGSGQPNLNTDIVKSIAIPIPPEKEIQEIVSFIKETIKLYSSIESGAMEQVKLLQERRTALISAAVTGKIDVRDWVAPDTQDAEEPEEASA
ncbi:Type I restriction enzyme EcoKI specificity protein [Raoultella planticola]|uniref:restriction endonuclease subunit S n=1 Tax=Raoultella planticola TaxID=575 RepID=UPI0010DB3759|nr:restriction endonuclease subunit S [Raoultella planticola]VTN01893.1 Type I restriction enzyme EcoKI specificity protein [Raoultella planticola]